MSGGLLMDKAVRNLNLDYAMMLQGATLNIQRCSMQRKRNGKSKNRVFGLVHDYI